MSCKLGWDECGWRLQLQCWVQWQHHSTTIITILLRILLLFQCDVYAMSDTFDWDGCWFWLHLQCWVQWHHHSNKLITILLRLLLSSVVPCELGWHECW